MAVYDFECCHLPDERFVREERFVLRRKLTTAMHLLSQHCPTEAQQEVMQARVDMLQKQLDAIEVAVKKYDALPGYHWNRSKVVLERQGECRHR